MANDDAETGRVRALERLRILDRDSEPPFDRIVDLAARLFDTPHAAIHLLDRDRQWVKAFHGTSFECAREDSSCQHVLAAGDVLVVPDMSADPRFRDLPHVAGPQALRFYAGAPLRTSDGHAVGTLCVLDTRPRPTLSEAAREDLRELANIAVEAMELRVRFHHASEALRSATEVDPITGLRNRAGLVRILQRMLSESHAEPGTGVLKVRIDRMDLVQGAAGEPGCNAVLREAGARIQRLIGDDELLGRGEGNAFIVARVDTGPPDGSGSTIGAWAAERARQIRAAVAEPFRVEGEEAHLSASVGAAMACGRDADAYALVDEADTVARQVQRAGGDRLRFADEQPAGEFRRRLSLEARLRSAVREGAFSLAYQPIVDLRGDSRVHGAEALVRWYEEDGRPVCGPDVFIPMAEELGLIDDIGRWVLEQVASEHARRAGGAWPGWIAVNLSPYQLHARGFARRTEEMVRAAGVAPADVCLEITESAIEADFDEIRKVLEDLRAIGFRLALDDFGTGHSSLARVIQLPFHRLKIDRGFVNDCPNGPGAAVVSSLARMTEQLGLEAVAEGVEYATHERYLVDHGVRYAQGFRYARPMPAPELAQWLEAGALPLCAGS